MIEVVFNDSEKGSMRCGQHFSNEIIDTTAFGFFCTSGEHPTQEECDAVLADAKRMQEQRLKNGKPLGGQPDDVIGLSFALDIGNIESSITGASRRELIVRMLGSDPWHEMQDIEESINCFWNCCISDLDKLMTRAMAGESVRIWYGNAPYSMCGFYNTIYQLKNSGCSISAVKLPSCMPYGECGAESAVSWSEISPGEFANYLPLEFEIPDSVQKAVIMEWEKLKQENAPLRVVLNGKLHSVEMDFYDRFIRKEIPDGTFKVAQLIGLVLGRNQLGVGDWLIAQRVQKMIESGELTVTQTDSAFYGTTLKKS